MPKNFVSNKDETARMFKSPFLESLSRIHWSVPLFIFVPVIAYFLYRSLFTLHFGIANTILFYICGTIIWSFSEYALHRFLFHTHFPGKLGERISFIIHGVHHDYPKDSKRLVMVPTLSIPLAIVFYLLFYILFGPLYSAASFAGLVSGYLVYDMTHYAIHHYNTKNPYWLRLKKHHSLHHYSDPYKSYGVSSKMWDHVFSTIEKEETTEETGV